MNNQDQVPTIAELWELMEARLADANDDLFYMSDRQFFRKEAESLRQQLLERCKAVNDIENRYTRFSFCENEIVTRFYEPLISDTKGTANPRADSAATARELGSAYLFWAWELEQREKESKDD